MTIERGTTQDIRCTVRGIDLSETAVYVTFKQDSLSITKHDAITVDYSDRKTVITVSLTQEETLSFKEGRKGEAQIRWRYPNGQVGKTNIKEFDVGRVLYEAVLNGE